MQKVPANKAVMIKGRRYLEGEALPPYVSLKDEPMTREEAENLFDKMNVKGKAK